MQLIFPSSGRAEILGRPIGDVSTRQRIGYLPENPHFYDYLTAEELLTYFARLFGFGASDRRKRVAALLDRVGIGARAPAAAPQVLERHDPAGRHRPGPAERSGSRVPGRADVRSRSLGPARRSTVDTGVCAIRGGQFSSARTSSQTPRRSAAGLRSSRKAGSPHPDG